MLKKLQGSLGLRQSAMTGVGNIFSAGLSAIAMMVISRQLGPERFGVFSVGFALVLILSRFSDFGLTFAQQQQIPKTDDKVAINRLFSYVIRTKIYVVIGFVLVGIFVSRWTATVLDVPVWVILLSFLLNGATVSFEQLAAMYQSLHRFRQAVYSNVIQSSTKMVSALILLILGVDSPLMYFVAYMGAPAMSLVGVTFFMPSWLSIRLKQSFESEQRLVKTMALHAAIGYMAAGIIENVDVLLVQGMLNTYDTGLLAGANRVAMLFTMMAFSLATVMNPRVAKYTKLNDLRSYLKKSWLVAGGCLAGFGAMSLLVKPLIIFTIGHEYLVASETLLILLAGAFLTIAAVPFIAVFFAMPKMEWYFSMAGILQVVVLVGLTVWMVPVYGFYGAALARLVMKLFLFFGTIVVVYWGYYRYQHSLTESL